MLAPSNSNDKVIVRFFQSPGPSRPALKSV
jgi:hypothetical protein